MLIVGRSPADLSISNADRPEEEVCWFGQRDRQSLAFFQRIACGGPLEVFNSVRFAASLAAVEILLVARSIDLVLRGAVCGHRFGPVSDSAVRWRPIRAMPVFDTRRWRLVGRTM